MLQTYWPIALGVFVVVVLLLVFFRSERALNRQSKDRADAYDVRVSARTAADAVNSFSSNDRELRS